jgi:hypothetical protein
MQATATVATQRPERYIKQLVSHLGHRLTTEVGEDGRGVITSEYGRATLEPADGALVLTVTADDAEALARLEDVIARHLVRFATAEELTVTWT